jgi:hypothetical protein
VPDTVRNFGARCLPRSGAANSWHWCGRRAAPFVAASGSSRGFRASSDLPLLFARDAAAHARIRSLKGGMMGANAVGELDQRPT